MTRCITPTELEKLRERARMLLERQYGQPTIRHTLRSVNGLYAVNMTGYGDCYEVELNHWQDMPIDEASEQSCIERYEFQDYNQAYRCLTKLLLKEVDRGLQGYSLVKPESLVVRAGKYFGRAA